MKRNNINKEILKKRIKEKENNPTKLNPLIKVQNRAIKSNMVKIEGRYMMATKAYHLLGDISRNKDDLCYISWETEDYYIGNWVTGFGFIEVLYPKETTRLLTKEEVEKYNKTYIQLADYPAYQLKVD